MLEGAEVVFIVLGFGAGEAELLRAGSLGALAALVLVIIAGVAVHRPLARVPENQLKFLVGVLLAAFGTFWFGEGAGLIWPGADWSLAALVAFYLAVALIAVRVCLSGQAFARSFK
jgi:Ca2+/H+ antiporter, TMEM165/GDT1 family